MDKELEREVWRRAKNRCEYCLLGQNESLISFQIDHILARKHKGTTVANNLALSCYYCNTYKGPNIAGKDPVTRKIVKLYNPRRHKWSRHFRWNDVVLIGRTAIGRATIAVLEINHHEALVHRASLVMEGKFPPDL